MKDEATATTFQTNFLKCYPDLSMYNATLLVLDSQGLVCRGAEAAAQSPGPSKLKAHFPCVPQHLQHPSKRFVHGRRATPKHQNIVPGGGQMLFHQFASHISLPALPPLRWVIQHVVEVQLSRVGIV